MEFCWSAAVGTLCLARALKLECWEEGWYFYKLYLPCSEKEELDFDFVAEEEKHLERLNQMQLESEDGECSETDLERCVCHPHRTSTSSSVSAHSSRCKNLSRCDAIAQTFRVLVRLRKFLQNAKFRWSHAARFASALSFELFTHGRIEKETDDLEEQDGQLDEECCVLQAEFQDLKQNAWRSQLQRSRHLHHQRQVLCTHDLW